jgi:hypothetical protein
MSEYRISDWGFLLRDGKIIGWSLYDFFWAIRGRIIRALKEKSDDN